MYRGAWDYSFVCFFFFLRFYLSLKRGEGKEKEREKNIRVWLPLLCSSPGARLATQMCALTGNWTNDPLVRRPALNPLSHTNQGRSALLYFYLASVLALMGVLLFVPLTSSVLGFSWHKCHELGLCSLFSRPGWLKLCIPWSGRRGMNHLLSSVLG